MLPSKTERWRFGGGVLLLAGVFLLLTALSAIFERQASQRSARAELDSHVAEADSLAEIRISPSEEPGSEPRPEIGSIVGRLVIPAGGVDVIAFEGVDRKTLDRGAGHFPGTALPGRPGNSAFAAHRDVEFRGLRHVSVGDDVYVDTGRATFVYRIESTQVAEPSEVEVLEPRGGSDLTLITCFPFDWVGPAPRRYVVHAEFRGRFEPEDGILADVLDSAREAR